MGLEIALLRGINVGGNNILPMGQLRALLSELGAEDARTYIQSGNAAYRGALGAEAISAAILERFGFSPDVITLPFESFEAVRQNNPFPDVEDQPKALHVFFLASPSLVDENILAADKAPEERFVLTERALYLHTPKLLSGSRLAERLERRLGVATTGRNWRTVEKIAEMARQIEGH